MTIDKAIKILKTGPPESSSISDEDEEVAGHMAIGALERVKAKRLHFEVDIDRLLPGETKE